MNLGELVASGGTSISECRVPPPYLSLIYQSACSALAINKEDLYQRKGNAAFQLPYTPASLTFTLTSAITSRLASSAPTALAAAPTCAVQRRSSWPPAAPTSSLTSTSLSGGARLHSSPTTD